MKADLRVQKTKQMLYQALVELMEEYAFNEIKTVMVIRRAGVTKNTFYRHYNTLYELYYEMMEAEVERINGALYDSEEGTLERTRLRHIEMILANQRVWRVALKETSPNILLELLVKHFERAAERYHNGRPDLQYDNYVSDGNIDLFRRFGCATEVVTFQYILANTDKTPQELADKINENFVSFGESAVRSDVRKMEKKMKKMD
jgi:AcrR family transcriptional regulator